MLRPAKFDGNILALDVARLFQAAAECSDERRPLIGRAAVQMADHRHRRLLRARGKRPRRRRAAEQRDERAAPDHSITSSAPASSVAGTVRLSILAVCALMTNSSLVACTTGSSAGLAPLRTRPA